MPDGRLVWRKYLDYVSMDRNNSFFIERNQTSSWPYSYYKPNGLYGFIEKVNLNVSSPEDFNPERIESNTAEAFVQFYIDPDSNDSITILDPGSGVTSVPLQNIKISGPGYRPATPSQAEEEYAGFAEIDTDTSIDGEISYFGGTIYDWSGTEDVNLSSLEFNTTYSFISVDNPGFDYAMPLEFKVIGANPTMGGLFTTPLPEYNSSTAYNFKEANFSVTTVGPNGSIEAISVDYGGEGYVDIASLQGDDRTMLEMILVDKGYLISEFPFVSITGGGGYGARFLIDGIDATGAITSVSKISGGQGYVNTIKDNFPTAVHTPTLGADEKMPLLWSG